MPIDLFVAAVGTVADMVAVEVVGMVTAGAAHIAEVA